MNKDELIADYLKNRLSHEAQQEFDHLMATDSEFAKEVTFQENLKSVIKKEEHTQLKQQLKAFETLDTAAPAKSYLKWFIAASIVALLAIPSMWFFTNTSINNDELFAANFEPYRNVVHPIVRGETAQDIKTKAFIAYETKNYEEALGYFNKILKESEDETILFYKANVLLQLNKGDDAIAIFENNLKTSDSLNEKNQWYLALAYLKNNNIDQAKHQLQALITSNSKFKSKTAKQLLKKID